MCPPAALSSTVHLMNSQFLLWDVYLHSFTKALSSSWTRLRGHMVICAFPLLRTISCPSCLPCSTLSGVLHCRHCSSLLWLHLSPHASLQQDSGMFMQVSRKRGFFLLVFSEWVEKSLSLMSEVYYNCDLKCLLQVSHVHVQKLFIVHWTSIRNIV